MLTWKFVGGGAELLRGRLFCTIQSPSDMGRSTALAADALKWPVDEVRGGIALGDWKIVFVVGADSIVAGCFPEEREDVWAWRDMRAAELVSRHAAEGLRRLANFDGDPGRNSWQQVEAASSDPGA